MTDNFAQASEVEELRQQVRDFRTTLVGTPDWPVGRVGLVEKEVKDLRIEVAMIPEKTKTVFLDMLENSNNRRDLGFFAKLANIVVAIFVVVVASFIIWHFGFNR